MKVIIAGSREINSLQTITEAVMNSPVNITEVVSGTARGVDKLGEEWARLNMRKVTQFPADWVKHKKAAGFIRNAKMGDYADALIAVWDGESRGTKNMIEYMQKLGKPVYIHKVTNEINS